ncbi:MAG TPA: hypothetical protein VK789_00420 [Bryobacteraceae bacterium]|nr:hypothetical protein [Bryobacteraceae bacterium]
MRPNTLAIAAVGAIVAISNLTAGAIDVNTGASATATYGTFGINAGPFPWSDLGFTAGASVSNGQLQVQTGGSTAFNFNTTLTSGENFIPTSTQVSLGYNPGWSSSSFNTTSAATGNLNSKFVYNIGPFSGSDTLLNVNLGAPGASKDLSSALNAGSGLVNSFTTANGPGVSASLTLSAQAFFVTVASATLGINIGTQIQQSVSATPTVTNGDLVWYDTTQTYNASDPFTFVSGSGGDVLNTFETPPASLGLTGGETFYMNILPVVELNMPVTNDSQVNVPASIFANWDIFGDSGSHNWPLGNLFSLGTGPQTFNFNPTFYGNFFYSVPLEYMAPNPNCPPTIACFPTYQVEGSTPNSNNGGIPPTGFNPPTGNVPCDPGVPCPAPPGGYGNPNMGPLFPENPNGGAPCNPLTGGDCITTVNLSSSPEPDGAFLLGAGLLLIAVSRGFIGRKAGRTKPPTTRQ